MIDQYQISLKTFLKNEKGETLILREHPTSNFGRRGFSDLPGGRIDENEITVAFEDILKREIQEELGDVMISVSSVPIALGRRAIESGQNAGKRVLYIFFESEYLGGDVRTSHEHLGYEWVNLSAVDIEKYFTPEFLPAVKMYLGR